jgi:hypothetical protein
MFAGGDDASCREFRLQNWRREGCSGSSAGAMNRHYQILRHGNQLTIRPFAFVDRALGAFPHFIFISEGDLIKVLQSFDVHRLQAYPIEFSTVKSRPGIAVGHQLPEPSFLENLNLLETHKLDPGIPVLSLHIIHALTLLG